MTLLSSQEPSVRHETETPPVELWSLTDTNLVPTVGQSTSHAVWPLPFQSV